MSRTEQAAAVLQSFRPGSYILLGAGFAGVVFRDESRVYKVHVPSAGNRFGEGDHVYGLLGRLHHLAGARHFFDLEALVEHEGTWILIYPWVPSVPAVDARAEEWISVLAEMWERRILCRNISLRTNFVRVDGVLKLIDYEMQPLEDNAFLNLAARAYVQTLPEDPDNNTGFKLRRSVLNSFELPELEGFPSFIERLFERIADAPRRRHMLPAAPGKDRQRHAIRTLGDVEHVLRTASQHTEELWLDPDDVDPWALRFCCLKQGWRLHSLQAMSNLAATEYGKATPLVLQARLKRQQPPSAPVTLLLKACLQDAEHLAWAARHIVQGLSGPERYHERVLAVDLIRRHDFVRQYAEPASEKCLLAAAQCLLDEGVIDRVVRIGPDPVMARHLNQRWFGLDTDQTHTVSGVPVTVALQAFDAVETDLVLQVDIDILVGTRRAEAPFLEPLIQALAEHPDAVSVGVQICQPDELSVQRYHGNPEGGPAPDPRACLLSRSRLARLAPLPNAALASGLQRTWYRATAAAQAAQQTRSLHGGPTSRFYVHPQNYRKSAPSTWPWLIDRMESGAWPEQQAGRVDVVGSIRQWSLPQRTEETVMVLPLGEEPPSVGMRALRGLLGQRSASFGILLIDRTGQRRARWIAEALGSPPERLTTVDYHHPVPKLHAVQEAIARFVQRAETWIGLMDPGDQLLDEDAVGAIVERLRLYGADVSIGKECSRWTLSLGGKHRYDFLQPRRNAACLADGIAFFSRRLVDGLRLEQLAAPVTDTAEPNTYARRLRRHAWDEDPACLRLLVPAVERCTNPVRIDRYTVLRQRSAHDHIRVQEVAERLQHEPRPVLHNHWPVRRFTPNLARLELDITYACNLKCMNCNRSCTQAPTRAMMDYPQIEHHVAEWIALEHRWDHINVLGGEPTLHPQFQEIIRLLLTTYVDGFHPRAVVQVTSNGYGDFVRRQLDALPGHPRLVINAESFKESDQIPHFTPFNDAPIDDPAFADADFSRGCWVTEYCGVGLNHLGYFPCAVAGGIERVHPRGNGCATLEVARSSLRERLAPACQLCGNFKHYAEAGGEFIPRSERAACTSAVISPSWVRLYGKDS